MSIAIDGVTFPILGTGTVKFHSKDIDENLIQEIGLLRDLILNERDVNSVQDILPHVRHGT